MQGNHSNTLKIASDVRLAKGVEMLAFVADNPAWLSSDRKGARA